MFTSLILITLLVAYVMYFHFTEVTSVIATVRQFQNIPSELDEIKSRLHMMESNLPAVMNIQSHYSRANTTVQQQQPQRQSQHQQATLTQLP